MCAHMYRHTCTHACSVLSPSPSLCLSLIFSKYTIQLCYKATRMPATVITKISNLGVARECLNLLMFIAPGTVGFTVTPSLLSGRQFLLAQTTLPQWPSGHRPLGTYFFTCLYSMSHLLELFPALRVTTAKKYETHLSGAMS